MSASVWATWLAAFTVGRDAAIFTGGVLIRFIVMLGSLRCFPVIQSSHLIGG
jgi:hypothetical protein